MEFEIIEDFLPPPDKLVIRKPKKNGVKVTLSLSSQSVNFFKREAAKRHVPYSAMLQSLLEQYVQGRVERPKK